MWSPHVSAAQHAAQRSDTSVDACPHHFVHTGSWPMGTWRAEMLARICVLLHLRRNEGYGSVFVLHGVDCLAPGSCSSTDVFLFQCRSATNRPSDERLPTPPVPHTATILPAILFAAIRNTDLLQLPRERVLSNVSAAQQAAICSSSTADPSW
ncbi:hypothetical protein PLICRDRAFT_612029 [Plicaturopsis crispa FD-325 SS-3]|nr:hypothetical protein PLICRDRAFT_612029 [Plicaturopsis crispa FD-325 SS-3]